MPPRGVSCAQPEPNAYGSHTHRARKANATVDGFACQATEGGNVKAAALIALGGIMLVAAAWLGPAALAGGKPKPGDGRDANRRAELVGVNFVENCRFSHELPDDPIVFPGTPGASHQHTFVGNRTTNASSTFGSLRSGPTTYCRCVGLMYPTLFHSMPD